MSISSYRFSGIELDLQRRDLKVDDRHVEITPMVFDTLHLLLRNAGKVVTKDELVADVWQGRVVTDASITQAIRKARSALEECGVDGNIIATRHGHGYRLAPDVDVVTVGAPESPPRPEAAAAMPDKHSQRKRPFLAVALAVAGAIVLTLANISEIIDFFSPDEALEAIEATSSKVAATDKKVDDILAMLRNQASAAGTGLDPESEQTIRRAIQEMLASGDARKQQAVALLQEGDPEAAASSIEAVAADMADASEQARAEAATSWREAGALYYLSDIAESIRCYEAAYELEQDNAAGITDLGYAYIRAGRLDEAIERFGQALTLVSPSPLMARILRGLGAALKEQALYDEARGHYDRALEILDQFEDGSEEVKLKLGLGSIADAQGNLELARNYYQNAVDRADEIGDPGLQSNALNSLGIAMARAGEFDAARDTFQRSYDLALLRNDLGGQSQAIGNLGANALQSGDAGAAEGFILQSVEIGRRLGDQGSIASDLTNLGTIAAANDDFEQADRYFSEAHDIAASHGFEALRLIIEVNMGESARDRGEPQVACGYWREAYPQLEALGHGAAGVVAGYMADLDCAPAP